MPKIVEYQRQVLPSGGAGGQIQPYKDAPPMYPLTDPAAAAKVRFLREISDTAVDWMKIKNFEKKQNEESLATIGLMNFKDQGILGVSEARKVLGENAIATEGQPGITKKYYDSRLEQANDFIDSQSWSDSIKDAARKAFRAVVHEEASQVSAHESAQNFIVNNQAIDAVVYDAAKTMRAYPLDDAKAKAAMDGVLATLARRAPGNVDLKQKSQQLIVDARVEGLMNLDPDKAGKYLSENKLMIGDKYDALRKRVTFAKVEQDALINPGMALENLGAMENGQPKFYKELTSTERVAAISSVIAQVEGQERLEQLRQKNQDDDSAYSYYDIINKGIDPRLKNTDVVISSGQRGLQGISYLNDLVSQRKVSTTLYEHLLTSAKQGITTNFEELQRLQVGVSLGKISVPNIVGAEGVGAGDKAKLLDHKRSIDNMNAQLGIMQRNELNTVRSMAERLMLPGGGIKPSDAQVQSFLKFNFNLNEAVKKGKDPTDFYISNGWRYMEYSIPATVKGTPKDMNDAVVMGYKLTQDYKLGRISTEVYNIESQKIDQAKKIFNAMESSKETEKRRTEKGR